MRFAGFAEAARRLFIGVPVLAGLLAWPEACAQTPEALNWYSQGVQALEERRFSEARVAFLQAISADPTFAGAWLDLAIAAEAEGDSVQAEEFLTILEARFNLPPAIARGVASLRSRIQAERVLPGADWRWRALAQAGGGHDTNANAGLALKDLTLTLPGGGVALPLSASQQPRADYYALSSLSADGWRKLGDGQLEVSGSVRARANADVHDFDTAEIHAGVAYVSAAPPFNGLAGRALTGPWRVGMNAQQLRLGGNPLLNGVGFSALHAWKHLSCGPQAGLELDFRHFPVAPNLDSRLVWLSAGGACDSPWLGSNGRLGVQLRTGREMARGNYFSDRGRPGGDTRHTELTLSHRWSWAGRNGTHRLEAQAQWAHARDTEGYSPLLADNARRRLTRATGAVAYTLPLQPSVADNDAWLATLALQTFEQRSNLELFRLKGTLLQLTVQRSW